MLEQFLENLGSVSPSPGGGSAAGLVAATGTALVEMVARINQKRTPDPGAQTRILAAEKLRRELQTLMEEDAKAFEKISKAFKENKESAAYQKALETGAAVPLKICKLSAEAIQIGCGEVARTSRWLASDLLEAGILLHAAFQSARLNVEINLRSIQNETIVQEMRLELDSLEKEILSCKTKLSGVTA